MSRTRRTALIVAATIWLVVPIVGCGNGSPGRTAAAPLAQEAYVWQRVWNPAVVTAVAATAAGGPDEDLAGLTLLAAEVTDRGGEELEVFRVAYDSTAVPHRRAGLALRVNPLGRSLRQVENDLVRLAVSEIERATEAGLEVTEVQVDYDCPTGRLAEYARLIDRMRAEVAATLALADRPPVTWTALPDWLSSEEFRFLLATLRNSSETFPGYVLQVHSLRLPEAGKVAPLVDVAAARRAVERAAELGQPFRVALPTHGYEARFTAGGDLLGLAAEGAPPSRAARTVAVTSDAGVLAELLESWRRERPPELTGIAWFRLATGRDRRAWPRDLFRAVRTRASEEFRTKTSEEFRPTSEDFRRPVIARARAEGSNLVEIDLIAAATGGDVPAAVSISWNGVRLTASDGVGGFRALTPRTTGRVRLERADPTEPLRPRERRTIAWLRFDEPIEPREIHLAPKY